MAIRWRAARFGFFGYALISAVKVILQISQPVVIHLASPRGSGRVIEWLQRFVVLEVGLGILTVVALVAIARSVGSARSARLATVAAVVAGLATLAEASWRPLAEFEIVVGVVANQPMLAHVLAFALGLLGYASRWLLLVVALWTSRSLAARRAARTAVAALAMVGVQIGAAFIGGASRRADWLLPIRFVGGLANLVSLVLTVGICASVAIALGRDQRAGADRSMQTSP